MYSTNYGDEETTIITVTIVLLAHISSLVVLGKQQGVEENTTTTSRTARLGKSISLTTFSFAATKNYFLPVNLPFYKHSRSFIVVIYLRIVQRKFYVAQPRSRQNLECAHSTLLFCRGRREKPTRLYFALTILQIQG